MSAIIDRILDQLGDKELLKKLLSITKSDFNSLLLKAYQMQASSITPVDVVKAYKTNRFSTPSEINTIEYHALELELLSLAQKKGIEGKLISPSAPLASCSAFGCVDQNHVVSALRGTEILSDPANMLAIIIADKLKNKDTDNHSHIHYCTTARVLRAQSFPPNQGYYSHFGLFCIVSSGRDNGSYACEKDLMLKHLSYYRDLFLKKHHVKLSVLLGKRKGYTDSNGFFDSMMNLIKNELPDVSISFDLDHENNNYYKGINFKLFIEKENDRFEIGDGGYVDWIQRMIGSKKERCLISCISLDRLLLAM